MPWPRIDLEENPGILMKNKGGNMEFWPISFA